MLRQYDISASQASPQAIPELEVTLPSFRAHLVYNFFSLNSWVSVISTPIEQQVVFSRAQRAIAQAMTIVMVMAALAIVHVTEGTPEISNVQPESASVKELFQKRLAVTMLNTLLLFPVRQVLRRGIKLVHEKRSCTEHDLNFTRSTILRLRYLEYQCIRSLGYENICDFPFVYISFLLYVCQVD